MAGPVIFNHGFQGTRRKPGIVFSYPFQRTDACYSGDLASCAHSENHLSSMETFAGFVAEAALSPAFDALFGKLSSQDVLKYACGNEVKSQIDQWTTFLHKMKCVLDDAEERQMGEGPIKLWLDELRDLAYDVEDILDDFSYEVLRQKVMSETEASSSKVRKLFHASFSRFKPRDTKFNLHLGKKMKEITQRFEAITKEKESLGLKERETGGSNVVMRKRLEETTCLVQESQVYGRENDKETLVNVLLRSGKPVSVVAIVGMGGLGKTTLAQLVYNEETVSRSFDIKAWVCVSDEFDVFKISVKIIESFTSSTCDLKDLNNVQNKLKDAVQGKKFLLILDDVWNEDYLKWDALSRPFLAGGLGSKVLITTRHENVASTAGAVIVHHLKKLKLEECLSLLAVHAFGVDNFNGHPALQEVGEQIAKKCDGLPLAAKAIGGLLRGKLNSSEWEKVLNSNMWSLKCSILPALRVSYHYLPSHLKRCFAYCAIFPKDYEFDKDDLVLWWMAQGFLEQSLEQSKVAVGNDYFEDLLSRSFFQRKILEGSTFVMHDLMNDLALWVNEGICLHLPNYEGSNYNIKFGNLRHLSFMNHRYEIAKRFEKFSVSTGLKTFLVFRQCYDSSCISSIILDRVIPKMRCLKLLCLRGYRINEVGDSISNLKNLRLLDMSFTTIELLPESICDLLNLQVLKLRRCENLVQLPREIRKLINLRVLDIKWTYNLKVMPSGVGRLENLEILSKFIVGENDELRLKELTGLSLLRGELSIWGLEKVVDVEEARDANLKAKKDIVSLEFKWKLMEETNEVDNENQVRILDELQPCTSLKSLKIDGYNGKLFPKWVGDFRFTNLESLSLRKCKSASSLPPMGGLKSLKKLIISGMPKVKRVDKEILGNVSDSNQTFPSLETLILEEMNELEEWCFGEESVVVFPRLQKIEIRNCLVLVGKLPNELPLLEKLIITNCPNLRNLECTYPSLQTLFIKKCPNLRNLKCKHPCLRDKEILGNVSDSNQTFPFLETLILEKMNGLEEWCFGEQSADVFPRLQQIEIRDCPVLVGKLPNQLPLLEELIIINCPNLRNLKCKHPCLQELAIKDCSNAVLKTLGDLNSLKILKLENIREMIHMEDELLSMLGALEELEIEDCKELKSLVRSSEKEIERLPGLHRLRISNCNDLVRFGPMRLPSSLKQMDISECKALECLPEGFMLDGSNTCESALEKLSIRKCPSLPTFPRGRFPDLLVELSVTACDNLESMPKFSNAIKDLKIKGCNRLRSLPRIPNSILSLNIGNLTSLGLDSSRFGESMLVSSDTINVECQSEVESELDNMFALSSSSLEELFIRNIGLRRLPENITSFHRIRELDIRHCENLRWLPKRMQELECLRSLRLWDCPNLELLVGQDLPRELEELNIWGCEKVIQGLFAGGLSRLPSLTDLIIDGGSNLVNIIKSEAPLFLPKLQTLEMSEIGNLESLAAAFHLPSIEQLHISECPKMRELPMLHLSSNLGHLEISGCPVLEKICLDRKGDYWPLLSTIPRVQIDGKDVR